MSYQVSIHHEFKQNVGFSADVFDEVISRVIHDHIERPELEKLTVSIVWIHDDEMAELNQRYRDKEGATDVLSFSYLDIDPQVYLGDEYEIGELVISVDTLKKQAKEHSHKEELEARILIVHGLLHILGFDHENMSDLQLMMAEERKYLGDKAGLILRSQTE